MIDGIDWTTNIFFYVLLLIKTPIFIIVMIDLAASITSSTVATVLLYPIERLKIEMQLNHNNDSIVANFSSITDRQGLKGFYQGLTPLVVGNGLAYGIYFVAYEKLKLILHTDPNSLLSIVQCSGLAGCIGSIATNPFYVLQTRQSKENKPILEILQKMIKDEGLTCLWKGMLASIILVTNPIIQFVTYEFLKRRLSKDGKPLSSWIIFLIGAISKILATLFTYPYTLLRTRQQITKASKDKKQITLTEVFKDILERQGFLGIFKGLTPKLLQTTLNSALILMIYEKIKHLLQKKFQK